MEGKVEEIDRGRVAAGQEVRVRIDSLPELNMPGQARLHFAADRAEPGRVAAHAQLPRLRADSRRSTRGCGPA